MYENSTADMRFTYTGLTPYTRYTMVVRAKAAGEVGPAAEDEITTPPEGRFSKFSLLRFSPQYLGFSVCKPPHPVFALS